MISVSPSATKKAERKLGHARLAHRLKNNREPEWRFFKGVHSLADGHHEFQRKCGVIYF
jgi:hypothetical protein